MSLLNGSIFGRRTTLCFQRHIIYWFADKYTSTQAFWHTGDESQSLFYLFLFEFCMYIYGTDSTIFGRLTIKTDLHQQHDKMACVDEQLSASQ